MQQAISGVVIKEWSRKGIILRLREIGKEFNHPLLTVDSLDLELVSSDIFKISPVPNKAEGLFDWYLDALRNIGYVESYFIEDYLDENVKVPEYFKGSQKALFRKSLGDMTKHLAGRWKKYLQNLLERSG